MTDKVTAPKIRAMKKRGERIVSVTAYDATFGAMADEAGVDLILVGDSVGNVMLGYDTTVPVTLDQIVHHTKATRAGVSRALLVADLPFGSYQVSTAQAMESAICLMKAGADAVKLEGNYSEAIKAMVRAGIPVMGHVGMTPQSVNKFGGFRVQGRGEAADQVVDDAKAIDDAGVFSMVLELVPAELAKVISAEVGAPTIGIGAGPECDGQIQVLHDVLGLSPKVHKHAKRYVSGHECLVDGLRQYSEEVRSSAFPEEKHSF
jgi:3-methyl-2-oxobutanoate hydroxymethyltransferase